MVSLKRVAIISILRSQPFVKDDTEKRWREEINYEKRRGEEVQVLQKGCINLSFNTHNKI